MDLFDFDKNLKFKTQNSKFDESAPLAVRMRPRTLVEFVGQEHILGEGGILKKTI